MDFFALQDKARKQTRFLVFLFLVAVTAITLTINLVFYFALNMQTTMPMDSQHWFSQPYWLYITGGTVALIVGASLWRSYQLRASPDAIAKMVNATAVSLSSKNNQERVLVNVVEEMSIASGMPIPKIFIMREESGINAFVAGLEPSKVTLVVTQGLLDTLNRQELQGVIAHEYSHVFHGDMRINVRLIGILAGILIIGQIGGLLLRSGSMSSRSRRSSFSSSSNSKNSNAGGLIAVGIGLFVVGYIGLFFGRLIKAAISRQREFLADASAVQYTRDKDGIAGALFKIGQHSGQALLNTAKAEEMSHMCFGESIKQSFGSMLATHPPINDRINAINPNFIRSQKYTSQTATKQKQTEPSQPAQAQDSAEQSSFSQVDDAVTSHFSSSNFSSSSDANSGSTSPIAASSEMPIDTLSSSIKSEGLLSHIGDVSAQQILQAKMLINSIPRDLILMAQSSNHSNHSYLLVLALLISNQDSSNNHFNFNDCSPLNKDYSEQKFDQLMASVAPLNFQKQHCLLDLSLARIEQHSHQENKQFVALLARLVSIDDNISLSEFMIYASITKRALPKLKQPKAISRFNQISDELISFFNLLYQQSSLDAKSKQQQLERQLQLFGIKARSVAADFEAADKTGYKFDIKALSLSLNKISRLNPLLKGDFMLACIDIINNDGEITKTEYELLRILGEFMDSPLPLAPQLDKS